MTKNAKKIETKGAEPRKWMVYIPEEGHWPIEGTHTDAGSARRAYLAWAERKRMPRGARICPAS